MTLALERRTDDRELFDEDQFSTTTPEWVNGVPISRELAAQRLGHNATLLAVWDGQVPLLDGGERSQSYWDLMHVAPLIEVPTAALPEDIQDTEHKLLVLDAGDLAAGAYKIQGVINAVLAAHERGEDVRKLVAFSTGNHAASVALAGAVFGIPTTVYMPKEASAAKVENTEQYNANVVFKSSLDACSKAAAAHGEKRGALLIHPYDMEDVVHAQGVLSAFLRKQLQALGIDPDVADVHVYAPIGGGGVAASNAVSSKVQLPNSTFHGVQAQNANPVVAMLGGEAFDPDPQRFDTSVDGAAVRNPGKIGTRVLSVAGVVHKDNAHTVSLGQIGEAMAIGARVQHTRCVRDGDVYTGSISDTPEPAGAEPIAAAVEVMREAKADKHSRGTTRQVVHIALVTGINSTSAKVHEFASHAHNTERIRGVPYLGAAAASELVSRANTDSRRVPNQLEERALALAAARRAIKPMRNRNYVVSGK